MAHVLEGGAGMQGRGPRRGRGRHPSGGQRAWARAQLQRPSCWLTPQCRSPPRPIRRCGPLCKRRPSRRSSSQHRRRHGRSRSRSRSCGARRRDPQVCCGLDWGSLHGCGPGFAGAPPACYPPAWFPAAGTSLTQCIPVVAMQGISPVALTTAWMSWSGASRPTALS